MMISYARIDPAFAPWLDHRAIAPVLEQMEDHAITVDTLAPGVYRLDAAGPKLLAVAGEGATLLIDAGYAPAAASIRRAIAAVGAPRVGYVINTHAHEDHVGGNAEFGTQAVIFAHPAVRDAMRETQPFVDGVTVPARSGDALPERSIARDTTLSIAGVTVRVIPLPAHTDGDLLVYLPGSHVLHMGDSFFPRTGRGMVFPGSEPERFVERLRGLLNELPDDTRVVAGHDPVVSLSELREQFARTVELVERIRTSVDDGLSVDSTVAVLGPEGFRESWVRYLHRVMGGGDRS
jgi:glyoxylase-like metal-dependent hydrolase (beta-lactamase superfamily II)